MIPYPKIPGPYKRYTEGPNRNQLIEGEWTSPELEELHDHQGWTWTEKIDGTNIRVHWDGYKVTFGGRTDRAQIPAKLLATLQSTFSEELMEQQFQDTPVTLYGEGYGAGIQKGGGNYRKDNGFILFDVRIGSFWLLRYDVGEVAISLGIDAVPIHLWGSIQDAIDAVRGGTESMWPGVEMEGLVGTAPMGLLSRSGARIMVKIKRSDFH